MTGQVTYLLDNLGHCGVDLGHHGESGKGGTGRLDGAVAAHDDSSVFHRRRRSWSLGKD